MRIAMFTNTYLPHLGGVARAVSTLADACRQRGHELRIVAPKFNGSGDGPDVLRVPAIQNFNGSDFSVQIPFPNIIHPFMDEFQPEIIHSHHPFLLGDAALREAWKSTAPIVFTHHTLYEQYTHYVPLDSPALKRVVIRLATEYCNLCDLIVAPSQSIATLLDQRGVTAPVRVIPSGIDTGFFASGDAERFRQQAGIARETRIIGHVGRLASEKNLGFLADAVARCLVANRDAVFLVVGDGDARGQLLRDLEQRVGPNQIQVVGKLSGSRLADAYAAMDWFVFASQSETQGLVLAEAMAAGKPVVALDGPGVREIVRDGHNGLLLGATATAEAFAAGLDRLMHDGEFSRHCAAHARATAEDFAIGRCAGLMLDCYAEVMAHHRRSDKADLMPWDRLRAGFEIEWSLLVEKMSAASAAVEGKSSHGGGPP